MWQEHWFLEKVYTQLLIQGGTSLLFSLKLLLHINSLTFMLPFHPQHFQIIFFGVKNIKYLSLLMTIYKWTRKHPCSLTPPKISKLDSFFLCKVHIEMLTSRCNFTVVKSLCFHNLGAERLTHLSIKLELLAISSTTMKISIAYDCENNHIWTDSWVDMSLIN